MHDPSLEYQKRLLDRQARLQRCFSRIRIVSYFRLGVGLVFFATLWLVFGIRVASLSFLLLPIGAYVVLALYHDRLYRERDRAKRAVTFYERGLERIENRWQGKGNGETSDLDDTHLYAKDLDLFGRGSLFELLCTARTRAGEETLARWLREPAERNEILQRQEAVQELRPFIDLREDLSLLGPEVRSQVHPEFMSEWANAPSELRSTVVRVTAAVLVGLNLIFLVYSLLPAGDGSLLRYTLAFEAVLGIAYRRRVRAVLNSIDGPAKELATLGLALQRMERETFSSERLRQLQTDFAKEAKRPSREIAFLVTLVENLNYRRNEFFMILSFPLLWATQFTFAIEAWRLRRGPAIGGWLANFGEFEALCALASYSYEHPEDSFPEVVEGAAILECEEVRHPLLPRASCVPNSLSLGGELQLLLVSGSNMSGKSTLLRTVGINVVLAQAGGPVRAARMKLCVLAIGATMRVQDSLQAGVSRFYAEVQRLHDTMELTAGPRPVLFLLDEILHGTNSHDRAIGAEAIVRGLVDRGAIGLVTTHDLALARVADSLKPRAMNVHFQDHLEDGRMIFDYVLHPGVVEKSNALELMRAVGLKV